MSLPQGRADRPALHSGVLVIDKPPCVTSHDVVAAVRRHLRGSKVGHTGTLDPMATGVLPLVVGKATRLARHLTAADKAYEAVIRLGRTTDSYDATGRVLSEAPPGAPPPPVDLIRSSLASFEGTWRQTPPAFSAKHSDGGRAYEQARRGIAVDLPPVDVTVSELTLLEADAGLVRVRIVCSAGFYVRSFAHQFGQRLGTGACLEGLRRTRSGEFSLDDAVSLERVLIDGPAAYLRPLHTLLTDWPAVIVSVEGADRIRHGREVTPAHCRGPLPPHASPGRVRVLDEAGALIALAEAGPEAALRPSVVLV